MSKNNNHITVFEHQSLRFDKGDNRISIDQFKALCRYHGEKGTPFFSLCYNGVKFNEHVGVIQVGKTMIEVLPKADKLPKNKESEEKWQKILIGMLKVVSAFDIKSTSTSKLQIRHNTILDLYFELFINEVEYLFRRGLVKQYRKQSSNCTALKGSLQFGQHINQNLVHKERFFVKHTVYDTQHRFNQILFKTLQLIKQINTAGRLNSRIGNLLLYFPEMDNIVVSEATFQQLNYNRKTEVYRHAIEIARLILLQYHPDLSAGRNHVLALMFDMNLLWEKFVLACLHKNKNLTVQGQRRKYFWKPVNGYRTTIRPDIVVSYNDKKAVLDTKWKNLYNLKPGTDDLRQMYVYHDYFDADKVALVYPSSETKDYKGQFYDTTSPITLDKECGILTFSSNPNIGEWKDQINTQIEEWLKN